jgi:hypothetical protein
MYSGEYDACDVTLIVYPHRASLKNMPGHGGNRTYDLWNTSTALPANRHILAHGILGFLIMRVPKSDAQRNICLVSGIYFIYPLVYTSTSKPNRFCHTVRTHSGLKVIKLFILPINIFFIVWDFSNSD